MKVIFERPELFGGFFEPVELQNIPRAGDTFVYRDADGDEVIADIRGVEWYPFQNPPCVYVRPAKLGRP
ncbi:MAG: hypothetical protein ACRDTZ_05355 [Pseudonocardiaceae bacterium]